MRSPPVAFSIVSLRSFQTEGRSPTSSFERAALSIFLVLEPRAIAPLYGEWSVSFATLEAGMMSQVLAARAAGCGLGLCDIGWVEPGPLHRILALSDDHVLLHSLVCRWCHGLWLHLSPGWKTRIEGRELLPSGPCVLVVNHQSAADILAVMGLFHPYKFVAKASLFSLPIVGWMMTGNPDALISLTTR